MNRIKDCLTDLQPQTNLSVSFHLEPVRWIQHLQALSFSCWAYATSKPDWSAPLLFVFIVVVLSGHIGGKRRLNFATFTTKERSNFPANNTYGIDVIVYFKFFD